MLNSLILALSLQAASVAGPPPAPMPDDAETRARIEAADARLFYAAFEGCSPDVLESYLLPDFRMIHDLDGLIADNRQAFVASIRESCVNRAPGGVHEGYKNRRRAVPGTRTFRRMGNWGAVENGDHVFFEWRGEAGWELVGGASYTHIWKWDGTEERFRLLESISYDHGTPLPYPPE